MPPTQLRTLAAVFGLPILFAVGEFPRAALAQGSHVHPASPAKGSTDSAQMAGMADHAMSGAMSANMMKHMELTPTRSATRADSVRALAVAAELKSAIAKYADTAAAVADGYKMFLPNVKAQHVYHFTNNRHALGAVFRFDATKPTSILYSRGADGKLHLVGAMYTMPKAAKLDRLNDRVPLSIARWHKHVNWCVPKKGDQSRWLEQQNGKPVFGPESAIATKAECDAAHGDFHPNLFGWMIHANVYEGTDLGAIFADDHGGTTHGAAAHPLPAPRLPLPA
jgi:hypothetical protein